VFRLPRLLAPLSVAAIFAIAAPAAHAGTTAIFPFGGPAVTTVQITDPGPAFDTVHLVVTAATPANRDNTKVFLGGNGSSAYVSIGVDGVRDARYDAEFENSELSTLDCSIYDSSLRFDDIAVTTPTSSTFVADLPKGEIVWAASLGVGAGIVGIDGACKSADNNFNGLSLDWLGDNQDIDGIAWNAPATPVITAATGGRQQVSLSFDQEPGTDYRIFRVVNGVRESSPFVVNVRGGDGDGVHYVIERDANEQPLAIGTEYAFQVEAHRRFSNALGDEPTSAFSATATAMTTPFQTIQALAGPSGSTTARSAQFSWSITANDAGDAPWCGLDLTENSGTEVPCSTTGASIDGLALGAHTFTVYPSYGDAPATYSWTVVAPPVVAPPVVTAPPATTTPKNPTDLDGDGITNNWLVGGKAAPAPGTPKAKVGAGKVELKLAAAPKGATKVRVYRADGKGGFKLVKTLTAKSKTFTDKAVKAGHTYKYKTVGVNAKGQQGKASSTATAKVKKK
jgi:hypothetical protein